METVEAVEMETGRHCAGEGGAQASAQVQGTPCPGADIRQRKLHYASQGARYKGKEELLAHLRGERLTVYEAVKAFCYECNGYYASGREDCKTPTCALYPFNPAGSRPGRRQLSDEERQLLRERFLRNLAKAGIR